MVSISLFLQNLKLNLIKININIIYKRRKGIQRFKIESKIESKILLFLEIKKSSFKIYRILHIMRLL